MTTRLVLIATVTSLLVPGQASAACATDHVGLSWGGFQPPIGDFAPVKLYWVEEPAEGESTVDLTIRATSEGSCPVPNRPAQAQYAVNTPLGLPRPATAGPAGDFDAVTSNTGPLWDHRGSPNEHAFPVTIRSDLLVEPVVEQARASITATDGKPVAPQEAPVWIVDSDGLSRASLESPGPYPQSELFRDVVVPVFRAGDASQPLSVDYSVAGSSSEPADPAIDLSITSPQPLVFAPGERVQRITMLLRADGVTERTEEATVSLSTPSVDPSDPVSATIQILDSAGGIALPTSTLHHPRQGWRYEADDYRLREIHVFTERGGGGSVTEAELAIRKNLKGGKCAWLAGKRFVAGPCDRTVWISSDGTYEPDFYYFRVKQLQPSRGNVKSYSAFSRATDTSKSSELDMNKGQNANTFKIRTPKK